MASCSEDFPTTDVLYDELSDDAPIVVCLCVAGLMTLICTFIYIEEVLFIKRTYVDNQEVCWKVLILLGLYPVVCFTSMISLFVPTSTILMDMVSGCYVSICIYTFVSLTISYFGDEDRMIHTLSNDKVRLNTPPCCCCLCCVLRPITLTHKSLSRLKLCVTQAVVLSPILLLTAAILATDRRYDQAFEIDSGYPYVTVPLTISTLLSFYGMIVICRASILHLKHQNLLMKFMVLQLMLIFTSLQRLIFNVLAEQDIPGCEGTRDSVIRGAAINGALLTVEALLLSLLGRRVYRKPSVHVMTKEQI